MEKESYLRLCQKNLNANKMIQFQDTAEKYPSPFLLMLGRWTCASRPDVWEHLFVLQMTVKTFVWKCFVNHLKIKSYLFGWSKRPLESNIMKIMLNKLGDIKECKSGGLWHIQRLLGDGSTVCKGSVACRFELNSYSAANVLMGVKLNHPSRAGCTELWGYFAANMCQKHD